MSEHVEHNSLLRVKFKLNSLHSSELSLNWTHSIEKRLPTYSGPCVPQNNMLYTPTRGGVVDVGEVYSHTFQQEQLATIIPKELVSYFRLISYGTETPGPNDCPAIWLTSGIAFCKKAILYYMADGSAQWNTQAQTGNPTMSKAVNRCIQEIKKHEVG